MLVIAMSGNPLAIGFVLVAMVFMGGHISGAHYNPAVTIAVFLRRKMGLIDAVSYMIAQVVAGVSADLVAYFIAPEVDGKRLPPFAPTIGSGSTLLTAFVAEFLITFALCMVVLNVATSLKVSNNSFYGLAIGFTVAAGAIAVGPVSGGVFNPAVGIGPLAVNAIATNSVEKLKNVWIYIVAPSIAGVGAALVFLVTNKEELTEVKQSFRITKLL